MPEPWTTKIGRVNCGDALELMRSMPDKCVDLCLTDPPYGIGVAKKQTFGGAGLTKNTIHEQSDWDNRTPDKEVFDEILRVSQNIIIFGGNYFIDKLQPSPCWIVWNKHRPGVSNNFADVELAWTNFDQPSRIFHFEWMGMLQADMKNKEPRNHPTQKPLPVIKWILNKYSEPDQTIFDPFMGSWTTAVAAKQLGRRFLGAELSANYCEIGRQRLRQEVLL